MEFAMVEQVDHPLAGRGIWTVDRGGDRKKLLEPLLDKGLRFVIRSTGERTVVDRRGRLRSVAEVALRCPLRHRARVVKIDKGQENSYELHYGAEPIRRVIGRIFIQRDAHKATQAERIFHAENSGESPG